jgi:hypothetical protein
LTLAFPTTSQPEPARRSTDRPDKDRFARLVLAGIRQAGEKRENVYDRSQFRLVLAAGAGNTMFLNNSYGEYCNASEAERDNTLARIVRNWFVYGKSVPEEFEDASHDLLPVVRARSYYTDAELLLKTEGQKAANVPYHQLGDDFAVALVYDPPHSNRHWGGWLNARRCIPVFSLTRTGPPDRGKTNFSRFTRVQLRCLARLGRRQAAYTEFKRSCHKPQTATFDLGNLSSVRM